MKVYHHPSCSKSRICVNHLDSLGQSFELVQYLKSPMNKEELISLLSKLKMQPSELVRKNEVIYKDAIKEGALSEDEILELMVKNPKLIERPIVEVEGQAIVARPIERLDAFLIHK